MILGLLFSTLFLGAVADHVRELPAADSIVQVWETQRRALQNSAHGAVDVNICQPGNSITGHDVGTLHDDQTDRRKRVDCTTGACNGAGKNNGYGDNLNCIKTLTVESGKTITLQIRQINLESGKLCKKAHGGVGCDVIEIYDGPSIQSKRLGIYSGDKEPAAIHSSGNSITVRFETDTANYALKVAGQHEDPGFYIDFHVTDHLNVRGLGICPAPAVYTDAHGSIHDDETKGVDCTKNEQSGDNPCDYGNCGKAHQKACADAGYKDNANCYTTIQAPKGDQIRFTFTQMNLELEGCSPGRPNKGCPDGGCDYVALYDGKDNHAKLIGKYSGYKTGADLPEIISTGRYMRVQFHTDYRNCGIANAEDPGWFADWDIVENGQNICKPDSAVLTSKHGVLRDDDITGQSIKDGNGYGNKLDCGVRLRAPRGGKVNFHLTQMNLEGDGNGICDPHSKHYIGHSCNGNGGDFLEIYDGRNKKAKLLAKLNGQPLDAVLKQDTFTSTGRDMFIRFTTDNGNYGLTDTTAAPGFYGEWAMLKGAAKCTDFAVTPNTGLIGHNNEKLSHVSVKQCQAACCLRNWCKSFDYIKSVRVCNLADVDHSHSMSSLGSSQYNDYYERPQGSETETTSAALGPRGCATKLSQISSSVTHACCANRCNRGAPPTCSTECAAKWTPFSKQCSMWIEGVAKQFAPVTKACEREEFGMYRAGTNHGRCSNGDFQEYEKEFAPACCSAGGGHNTYCPQLKNGESKWTQPVSNGRPICTPTCAKFFENMWSECHPRFDAQTLQNGQTIGHALRPFMKLCQGMPVGGGHRRLDTAADAEFPLEFVTLDGLSQEVTADEEVVQADSDDQEDSDEEDVAPTVMAANEPLLMQANMPSSMDI